MLQVWCGVGVKFSVGGYIIKEGVALLDVLFGVDGNFEALVGYFDHCAFVVCKGLEGFPFIGCCVTRL